MWLLLIHWLLLLLGNCWLLLWCHVTHHACPLLWVHGWSPSTPLLVCWLKLSTTSLLYLLELLLNLRRQLRLRTTLLHPCEHSLLLWV